jgi:hypothetical protein
VESTKEYFAFVEQGISVVGKCFCSMKKVQYFGQKWQCSYLSFETNWKIKIWLLCKFKGKAI